MNNAQRDFWDLTYKSEEIKNPAIRSLVRNQRRQRQTIIKQYLPNFSGAMVLEAGCGRGDDLLSLYRPKLFLVGLDYSRNSIKTCIKLQKQLKCESVFILGDILHLPFRDNAFDLVFNAGVIEHFVDHFAPAKEMVRVAKPGKYVVLFVPNMFSYWVMYKHIVNLISKITKKTKGWGVWEKSFNWFDLKKTGKLLGLERIKVAGIHLMHYYYVFFALEQSTNTKVPKPVVGSIINFLMKLDIQPSALSTFFGMELTLIGRKPYIS